jgi:hypothetical protein
MLIIDGSLETDGVKDLDELLKDSDIMQPRKGYQWILNSKQS